MATQIPPNLRPLFIAAGRKYNIPAHVLAGVAKIESAFGRNKGPSSAGAVGTMQFEPGTAKGLGINPYDDRQAIFGAAKLLNQYGYQQNPLRALGAYNGGPGNPQYGYAHMVMTAANGLRGELQGAQGMIATAVGRVGVTNPAYTNAGLSGGQVDTNSAGIAALLSAANRPISTSGKVGSDPILKDLANNISSGQYTTPIQANTKTTMNQASSPSMKAVAQGRAGVIAGAQPGSPIAGIARHAATHQTEGLAGFPAYDYMASAGTAVVAPVSGKIVRFSGHDPAIGPTEGPHGPFGWSIYLQGNDGHIYYLTHLGSRTITVGSRVTQGQKIGSVGNYAKYGTPSHVHMGVH